MFHESVCNTGEQRSTLTGTCTRRLRQNKHIRLKYRCNGSSYVKCPNGKYHRCLLGWQDSRSYVLVKGSHVDLIESEKENSYQHHFTEDIITKRKETSYKGTQEIGKLTVIIVLCYRGSRTLIRKGNSSLLLTVYPFGSSKIPGKQCKYEVSKQVFKHLSERNDSFFCPYVSIYHSVPKTRL